MFEFISGGCDWLGRFECGGVVVTLCVSAFHGVSCATTTDNLPDCGMNIGLAACRGVY